MFERGGELFAEVALGDEQRLRGAGLLRSPGAVRRGAARGLAAERWISGPASVLRFRSPSPGVRLLGRGASSAAACARVRDPATGAALSLLGGRRAGRAPVLSIQALQTRAIDPEPAAGGRTRGAATCSTSSSGWSFPPPRPIGSQPGAGAARLTGATAIRAPGDRARSLCGPGGARGGDRARRRRARDVRASTVARLTTGACRGGRQPRWRGQCTRSPRARSSCCRPGSRRSACRRRSSCS